MPNKDEAEAVATMNKENKSSSGSPVLEPSRKDFDQMVKNVYY
jgi:hypothetical protein